MNGWLAIKTDAGRNQDTDDIQSEYKESRHIVYKLDSSARVCKISAKKLEFHFPYMLNVC